MVIPQVMGFEIEMQEGKGPVFVDPLRDPKDLTRVDFTPDVKKGLGWAFEAIKLTVKKLDGRVPLIGFCGAPWTLLVYIVEGQGSKMFRFVKEWIYKYPTESHKLLQAITDCCINFLAQQVAAGCDMVQVFESWASELGPHEFNEFSLPYLKQISAKLPLRLKELGIEKVPMTVFAKGAWYALDELCDIGYDTVGLDWLYKPEDAVKVVNGRRITLQGNLDPGIMYGSKETITKKTEQMIKGFGGGKQNYIINFGHGTHPFMDPENIDHFLKECHRLGSA